MSTARALVASDGLVSHVVWWFGRSEYDAPLPPVSAHTGPLKPTIIFALSP